MSKSSDLFETNLFSEGVSVGSNTASITNVQDTETFETTKLIVTISKLGGYIKYIDYKDPSARMSFRGVGAVRGWDNARFEMRRKDNGFILEHTSPSGEVITKDFTFETPISLSLKIAFTNITDVNRSSYNILLSGVRVKVPQDPISQRYLEVAQFMNGVVGRKPLLGIKQSITINGSISWVGFRDKYFCEVVVPVSAGITGFDASVAGEYRYVWTSLDPNNITSVRMYFGTQDEKALRKFYEGTNLIVNYGMFDIIAKPLAWLLKIIQRVVKNWGVAIILLTIIVYTLLSPLSLKSMKSMRRMQSLQPQVEALKAKFKDNPQKLNQEIMALYAREKVNPLKGCLPMAMQAPVFYALYQVLMRSIELKDQGFWWIKDLSSPDRLFVFAKPLPFIGNEFNILPLLMAGFMVLQQKVTMRSTTAVSDEAAQQQKIMTTVMPVMFGVLFYKISSALVLYWFLNSVLSVLFQWKVNKSANGNK